ncbi:P-loop NTPase [Pseudomonas sp. MBLB4136]|uniref:P-loop NTPase n=1 Tax=Pseudomonas sp. MBLB4136 TaxID=3451558 RepID=UPI003F74EB6B
MSTVQVIAVTSGKSGAGKTSVAVNLALALADLGRRVVLLDADLAMGNVDVALGLIAERTLADVVGGQCAVSDVILRHSSGVRVVPAASGQPHMSRLSARQHAEIIHAVSELGDSLDYLIIDTAGGLSQASLDFVCAAREVLIVANGEPAAISAACALIRQLNCEYGIGRVQVLVSMARSAYEGLMVFKKLEQFADSFPDVSLCYLGTVPFEDVVRKSVQQRRAVYEAFPRSSCGQAYRRLAERVEGWPLPAEPSGRVEFFLEQLIERVRKDRRYPGAA